MTARPPRTRPPRQDPSAVLARLETLRTAHGDPATTSRKLAALDALDPAAFRSARHATRAHETLLYLAAFADDAEVHARAESRLQALAHRVCTGPASLRDRLDDTGLAGTSMHCSYSLPVLRWLLERGEPVALHPEGDDVNARMHDVWPMLLPSLEAESLRDGYLSFTDWLDRTGAASHNAGLPSIVAALDAFSESERVRSALWSAVELPVRWPLGARTVSRTLARAPIGAVIPWTGARRSRLDLRSEMQRPAPAFRRVHGAPARQWIDVARSATCVRLREMYTFLLADPDDVTVIEGDAGVTVCLYGLRSEARSPLRVFYGYLVARNGVPVGYGDALLAFDWCELNFHVFETFRQADSAQLYSNVIRAFYHNYGARFFHLNPYQFGLRNQEAIQSGAFWFYDKLGFSPVFPRERALWEREHAAKVRSSRYRSPARTLRALARGPMHLDLGAAVAYGAFHPMDVALARSQHVEREFSGDRFAAARDAQARVAHVRGATLDRVGSDLLGGLIASLPSDIALGAAELRALAELARAKAGVCESDALPIQREMAWLRDAWISVARAGYPARSFGSHTNKVRVALPERVANTSPDTTRT